MTGKCQMDQNSPSKIPGANALLCERIFGNTKPIQPISSDEPAGIPNNAPIRNLLGTKFGEANTVKHERTVRIRIGGMSSAAYQCTGNRPRNIREKRSIKPLLPPTLL